MSLTDALKEESRRSQQRRCLVCEWLTELSEDDRNSFNAWVVSGRSMAALLRASKKQVPPIPVERNAFERHCRDHLP